MFWQTLPLSCFPEWERPDTADLAAGRYGTSDMIDIWWAKKTIGLSLKVQGLSAQVLSDLYPNIVPPYLADEIYRVATSGQVDLERVREIEEQTWHDVIAINRALAEKVSEDAQTHINKAKTSADTTQPVRALQFKSSLEIIARVTENVRDILCEKAVLWRDIAFMDTSHLYDALPTTAGRPLVHYVEMLQSNLDIIHFVYQNSLKAKWGDATGNHHSATALWIDWQELQKNLASKLQVWYMDAAGQIPGLEFEADIFFAMARLTETLNNIARFIANGRSDDVNVFINGNPHRKKGSSAMPHKDAKNGNPTTEEQTMSLRNYFSWNLVTAMMNCEMPYARNLSASANARINFEDGFKFLDHVIRNLAGTIYWLEINSERSAERVERSFWVVTSQQVMTYLTDPNRTSNPMSREYAHDLTWKLALSAWEQGKLFVDVVLECDEITSRLDRETIVQITDPHKYIGQSREIIDMVVQKCYQKKTLKK